MLAEEYAAMRVGTTLITGPLVDVVRLTPAGRAFAAGPAASAIACSEGNPLTVRECALIAPHVEGLAGSVDDDGRDHSPAQEPIDCRKADDIVLTLYRGGTAAGCECVCRDEHPHGGRGACEKLTGVSRSPRGEQVQKGIGRELGRGPFVAAEALGDPL